ncbi:MAG: hypothetical protein AAFS01_03135 [Pseudomonadota bacterium]
MIFHPTDRIGTMPQEVFGLTLFILMLPPATYAQQAPVDLSADLRHAENQSMFGRSSDEQMRQRINGHRWPLYG